MCSIEDRFGLKAHGIVSDWVVSSTVVRKPASAWIKAVLKLQALFILFGHLMPLWEKPQHNCCSCYLHRKEFLSFHFSNIKKTLFSCIGSSASQPDTPECCFINTLMNVKQRCGLYVHACLNTGVYEPFPITISDIEIAFIHRLHTVGIAHLL